MLVIRIIMTVILGIKIMVIGIAGLSCLEEGDRGTFGVMCILELTDILAIISVWIL